MDSEQIGPFEAYRGLRRAHTGTQLESVFRALCYVLHQWCVYPSSGAPATSVPKRRARHEDKGSSDDGRLLLLEFDKLINIVCRMWDKMFQESGLKILDGIEGLTQEELRKIVRFQPPAQEFPGTHGPGRARRKAGSDDLVYLTRMAEQLVEEGFPYFAFEPRDRMRSHSDEKQRDGAERRLKSDEPHKWVVRPGLAVGDETTFWGGAYTQAEIDLIQRTGIALSRLGPTEIRALGTHKDQRGTMEEIRRELRWAHKACERLACALQDGRLGIGDASRLREYAHEARRKAILNEDYYASAYETMVRELSDAQLKGAFQAVQKPPSLVWGHEDIQKTREKVALAVGVADYVYGIAFFSEHPEELSSRREGKTAAGHSFEEGLESLRRLGIGDIPGSLSAIVEGNTGAIKGPAAERLRALLKDI